MHATDLENGDRPLPHSLEAERAVLGAALVDSPGFHEVLETLRAEQFFLPENRRIYACIKAMRKEERAVDLVTLTDALSHEGELESIGGAGYVASLADGMPRLSNVKHYSEIVKEKAHLRELFRIGIKLAHAAVEPGAASVGLTHRLRERAAALEDLVAKGSARSLHSWEDIPGLERVPDEPIRWLVRDFVPIGGIVLLAGEPGCFKTWLTMSLTKSVINGSPFLGRPSTQTDVLYLDRENPAAVWHERSGILGIKAQPNLRIWGSWFEKFPPSIGDPLLLKLAMDRRPLIVFDSFVRFHTQDENSATEMAEVMGELRRLGNAGASVLLLHHRSKSDSSKFRGSTDILAGVDIAFLVEKQEEDTLNLRCFKNRLGKDFEQSIRPELESPEGFALCEPPGDAEKSKPQDQIFEFIAAHPACTQKEVIEGSCLPKNKVIELLKKYERIYWDVRQGPHNSSQHFARNTPFRLEE